MRDAPDRLSAGPDGNLWFTQFGVGKLGRITPAGVITQFGPHAADPSGIAMGPDGRIWFTASYEVDRVTVP